MSEWQPIETAPKGQGAMLPGPMLLLASGHGHVAIGYWSEAGVVGNPSPGWVNVHDHRLMDYWNAFTHWMPLPPLPRPAAQTGAASHA